MNRQTFIGAVATGCAALSGGQGSKSHILPEQTAPNAADHNPSKASGPSPPRADYWVQSLSLSDIRLPESNLYPFSRIIVSATLFTGDPYSPGLMSWRCRLIVKPRRCEPTTAYNIHPIGVQPNLHSAKVHRDSWVYGSDKEACVIRPRNCFPAVPACHTSSAFLHTGARSIQQFH